MVVEERAPCAAPRERDALASTSTSGRYSARALPMPASAARASSQAIRVLGLLVRATSMISAREIGPLPSGAAGFSPPGARPAEAGRSTAGLSTCGGGVQAVSGAAEVPGDTPFV